MLVFPTLIVRLSDFLKSVFCLHSVQCPAADYTVEFPAVPNRTVSLTCGGAQPQPPQPEPHSIPAVPQPGSAQPQNIPNSRVSSLFPKAEPQSIPAVPTRRKSLQCPTAEHPCAVHNRTVSLQCSIHGIMLRNFNSFLQLPGRAVCCTCRFELCSNPAGPKFVLHPGFACHTIIP